MRTSGVKAEKIRTEARPSHKPLVRATRPRVGPVGGQQDQTTGSNKESESSVCISPLVLRIVLELVDYSMSGRDLEELGNRTS